MVVYQDIISGDNLLSDEFPHTEIFDGLIWDVEGKWVVRALDSAEGGDEDEGVDDQAEKIVNIVKTFKLQEVLPPFDKQQFVSYMKNYLKQITPKLDEEKLVIFKKNMTAAGDYLLGKLSDLQFFTGESMDIQGAMVFAYYKDGAAVPTFLYLSAGLKEV